MTKSLSKFVEGSVACGKCFKRFNVKFPIAINAKTDPDLVQKIITQELFLSKCPECGYTAHSSFPFFYHNPDKDYFVFCIHENYMLKYQSTLQLYDQLIEEYLEILPGEERNRVTSYDKKIVPGLIFLIGRIAPDRVKGIGLGNVHLSPLPLVNLQVIEQITNVDERTLFLEDDLEVPTNLREAEIVLREENLPDFYETLWKEIETELEFNRIYFPTSRVTEKHAVTTEGIPPFVIYIASSVVLPIILGIIRSHFKTFLNTMSAHAM